MDSATPSQERTEVDLVLQSGIFDKAPRLGHFFRYICDCHFEGQADRLKEYSIATEALGRSAEFDPKKDSIVRVEAHRLRRRLEEFYRAAGATHTVRISIPNGQYRPHFSSREEEVVAVRVPDEHGLRELSVVELPPFTPDPRANKKWRWQAVLSSLVVLLACVAAVALRKHSAPPIQTRSPASSAQNEVWTGTGAQPSVAETRILTGYHGPLYMDRQGHAWQADAYYTGGKSQPIGPDRQIEGEPDPKLLRFSRMGRFRYDIPLLQGPHELHLYFVETEYGFGSPNAGEGARTFRLSINGETKIALLDPLAEAGAPNRMHVRVFKDVVAADDGKLHLQFDPVNALAVLSGIEILPSAPGRIHPVRMVTQLNPVTDSDGRVWAADEFFSGGTVVWRQNVLINGKERALFQGERYGNFTYRIPLAPGKYKLTLHFAEQWFRTPPSGMQPVESRIFDVFANGEAILRNFCPGREAHGANRELHRSFENLQPNAQGDLTLEFVPVRNYAELNALEVVQMP